MDFLSELCRHRMGTFTEVARLVPRDNLRIQDLLRLQSSIMKLEVACFPQKVYYIYIYVMYTYVYIYIYNVCIYLSIYLSLSLSIYIYTHTYMFESRVLSRGILTSGFGRSVTV